MSTFIKQWFKFLNISGNSKKNIIQELDQIYNKFGELSGTISKNETNILTYIFSYLDTKNYLKNRDLFDLILMEVSREWNLEKKHYKQQSYNKFKQLLTESTGKGFIETLVSLELFKFLMNHSSDYVIEDYTHLSDSNGNETVFTVVDVLNNVTESISCQLDLLVSRNIIKSASWEIYFKKLIHSVIVNLCTPTNIDIIELVCKEFREVTTSVDFLEKKLVAGPSKRENFTKINLLKVKARGGENFIYQYNVWPTPATTIWVSSTNSLVVADFPPVCYYFLNQKNNKEHTTITKKLLEKLQPTLTTAYYIDEGMLSKTTKLIELELQGLDLEYNNLIKQLENTEWFAQLSKTENSLPNRLKSLINLQKSQEYKRLRAESSFFSEIFLSNMKTTKSPEQPPLVRDLINEHEEFERQRKRWCFILRTSRECRNFIPEFQKIFSKLLIIKKFLKYKSYIECSNISKVYFPGYIDFRGRLYYKSELSIQAYWCFRFIYNFGREIDPVGGYTIGDSELATFTELKQKSLMKNPAVLEIIKSIGFLQKKKITNNDGFINISSIMEIGSETYQKVKDFSVKEFWEEFNGDPKLIVEVVYYTNAVNEINEGSTKLFYVWKDSICSMAQHGGKVLGYNTKSLMFLNLNNTERACDTYQIFINKLKEELPKLDKRLWVDESIEVLDRSLLKNLIMTVEYGVTHHTAKKEYFETLENLIKQDNKYCIVNTEKHFESIFNYFSSGKMDLVFYLHTKSEWVDKVMSSKNNTLDLEDLKMPGNYYHDVQYTIYSDLNHQTDGKSRSSITLSFSIYNNMEIYEGLLTTKKYNKTDKINLRKTKTGLYVNVIHALDALFLRHITNLCGYHKLPIGTIHDGFAVPYTRGSQITSIACNSFFLDCSNSNLLDLIKNKQQLTTSSLTLIV